MLNKRDAVKIAHKLDAKSRPGGKHIVVKVYIQNKFIAQFNIRHDRKSNHDFIPNQIHVSMQEARELADCTLSQSEYVQLMIDRGHFDPPP